MEILLTPRQVVLSEDNLLLSSRAAMSTCRRANIEGWSREQLAVLQRAWQELPTNSLA